MPANKAPDDTAEPAGRFDFHGALLAALPGLRVYALALTHNGDRAEDLVQNTAMRALAGQASFHPGSFPAWIFAIARNEFVASLRRWRPMVDIDRTDCVPSCLPLQDRGLMTCEFLAAFARLPYAQREALVLSVVRSMPYHEIARHAGVSVGTIKSRVSRGRDRLAAMLDTGRRIRASEVAYGAGQRMRGAHAQIIPTGG